MGKKGKNQKKQKGTEKTAAKTEKKQIQKRKKELAALGEDDIEKIVAQIEEEEKKMLQVVECTVEPPSKRINFSFVCHPLKDELILFGGEYFDGSKTFVYNDLFFYKISRNEWVKVKAPGGPPPRCGHQMVALPINQGQLWLFGGEYASSTQEQFYHYRDLWVFHLGEKKWEKINTRNGPSSRSGHRMICVKKQLFVFGGYHDDLRDYKYFNDIFVFDLGNYTWTKLEPSGTPPSPRSACNIAALPDGRILIYGGYSRKRLKKDVDKGLVHTDMFLLALDKHDKTSSTWKWIGVKAGGVTVSPCTGMTMAIAPGGKAFTFGGVFDVEEDEDLAGTFYNDLYTLDLEKQCWRTVQLSYKKNQEGKKRRRKVKNPREETEIAKCNEGEESDEESGEENEEEMLCVGSETSNAASSIDDGVFTMTLGSKAPQLEIEPKAEGESSPIFVPSPRMNCGLAIKNGSLFLYGGLMEDGDRQLTYSDFYALDIHKLDEWKVIIPHDVMSQDWVESSSSDDDNGSETEEEEEEEEEEGEGKEEAAVEMVAAEVDEGKIEKEALEGASSSCSKL